MSDMEITNIIKLSDKTRKERYADKWKSKINPLAIAEYMFERQGFAISWKVACAMADAKIAEVYKELVLEEEEQNLKEETIEGRCEE